MTKQDEIASSRWVKSIRTALQTLDDIEMDEGIRKTIRRCVETEFSEAVDRVEDLSMRINDGSKWTDEDDATVREFLSANPVPDKDDYQSSRMLQVELAYKLGRSEKITKKHAEALGFRHFRSWY